MLSKHPRVAYVSPDEGKKLCKHYQLPEPIKVEAVSRTWLEPGWDTPHREFAALMVAPAGIPQTANGEALMLLFLAMKKLGQF